MQTIAQVTGRTNAENAIQNAIVVLQDNIKREYASRRVFHNWSYLVIKANVKSIRTLREMIINLNY